MCREPAGFVDALAMLGHALDALNAADARSLPTALQAQALQVLERAEAKHTAARASLLAAFATQSGYEDDGQGSARTWLRWQTRVTRGAAAGAVGWARRLACHHLVADALAAGEISSSWAKQICAWSDLLPAARREDADVILTAAARGGATETDLASLAREMYERSQPGGDQDAGGDGSGLGAGRDATHEERGLWLGITLGGAGRLNGDLAPGCAAALSAVLDSLSKKAGPEDTRTAAQRRHDALEEACRRLIAAGLLPDRAGQPAQIQLHLTLSQLRGLPGAAAAEEAWITARVGQPGWVTGPAADAADCDAAVTATVAGHVDSAALDRLVEVIVSAPGLRAPLTGHGGATQNTAELDTAAHTQPEGQPLRPGSGGDCGCTCGGCSCLSRPPLAPEMVARLRAALLRMAADVLSGPGGLASHLRRSLLGNGHDSTAAAGGAPLGTPSLPLDIPLDITGAEPAIPGHLRRAVASRDPGCRFPGCDQPASACQVHHLIPRSQGGPTALHNLVNLCGFHHLVVVHQWGWQLTLHADGTTTAVSPDGRTFHSHGPPPRAASQKDAAPRTPARRSCADCAEGATRRIRAMTGL